MGPLELTLGKTVDSADDMARLMIVTQYAGSDTVKVYASDDVDGPTGTKAGYIHVDDGDNTTGIDIDGDPDVAGPLVDRNNVRLRSAGAYYIAVDDSAALVAANAAIETPDEAVAQRVYYYESVADDPGTANEDETELTYLVLKSEQFGQSGRDHHHHLHLFGCRHSYRGRRHRWR